MIEVLIPEPATIRKEFTVLGSDIIDNIKYVRCLIDLTMFPIINRVSVNPKIDASRLYDITVKNLELQCTQKWVKEFLDKTLEAKASLKKTGDLKSYNVEQIKVLEAHGLDKNLDYQGVKRSVASVEDSDFYVVRSIEFAVSGFSSLPKTSEVLEKVAGGKKLTKSIEMMYESYKHLVEEATSKKIDINKPCAATRNFLQAKLKEVKTSLVKSRSNLAIIKMGRVLTGTWFDGFTTDDKGNMIFESDFKMTAKTEYTKQYV